MTENATIAPPTTPPPTSTPPPAPPSPPPAPPVVSEAPDKGTTDATNPFDAQYEKLKAKPTPAKPEDKKPDDKSAGDKIDATPPAKDDKKVSEGPKALRDQLEKTNGELKTTRERLQQLESKEKEWEARGKDTTALAAQIAAEKKEKETLQSELRALKQEASPEFKDKYDKPFNQAAEYAKRVIEQMTVTETNDAGEPVTRQATWDDFAQLYRMPSNKSIKLINQMFGDTAPVVIQEMRELQKLDYTRQTALQEEKAQWSQREQADTAKRAQEREGIQSMWQTVNKDIAEKHPEFYQSDPADPDGNTLLEDGYKMVDSALSNRESMTMQQKVILDANIRHRAAAFGREVHRRQKAEARVAELEAEKAELKGSGPGSTKRAGDGAPAVDVDWKDDLRKEMAT